MKPSRGFTLLEMLVVLVITGMVMTILMQALAHVFRLEANLGAERFNAQQGEMYGEWFRQSVGGLMPDHADGKSRFRGGEREFRGLSLQPLEAAHSLQPISWRLEFDAKLGNTVLRYGPAPGQDILSWEGNTGRFVYLDANERRHDAWPPYFGTWPQLPKAVGLEYEGANGTRLILGSPKGPARPLARLRDLDQ